MPKMIPLPAPLSVLSKIDLLRRRSIREFANAPIELEYLAAILYAAQGFRNDDGKRLAPSAGGSYPLKIRIATQNVVSLPPGLYLYVPAEHGLELVDERSSALREVANAAFDASWLEPAPAALLISAEFERTTVPYAHQPPEGRAERYVWLEAGHAAQNIALAAASLSLATVFIGGFHDDLMGKAFRSGERERPIGTMPLGYRRETP